MNIFYIQPCDFYLFLGKLLVYYTLTCDVFKVAKEDIYLYMKSKNYRKIIKRICALALAVQFKWLSV